MSLNKYIILPYDRYLSLCQLNNKDDDSIIQRHEYLNCTQEQSDSEVVDFKEVLRLFPRNIRSKSEVILSYIQREPLISWNHKLELCINKVPIRNSNIVDLIKSVQYRYKHFNPPGKRSFLAFLKKSSIPRTCITKWKNT